METLEQRGGGSIASVNPLVDKHKQLVNATGVEDVDLPDTLNSFFVTVWFFHYVSTLKNSQNLHQCAGQLSQSFSKQLPSVWRKSTIIPFLKSKISIYLSFFKLNYRVLYAKRVIVWKVLVWLSAAQVVLTKLCFGFFIYFVLSVSAGSLSS